MPLLRPGAQSLGEQLQRLGHQGELSGSRADQRTGDADVVAQIEVREDSQPLFVQSRRPSHDLQLRLAVVQIEKGRFAMTADSTNPTGYAQREGLLLELLRRLRVVLQIDTCRLEVVLEAMRIEIDPRLFERLALASSILDLEIQFAHSGSASD